tara:strand:+ start:206 stop:919 length:714 start_codon:yes stop_codon:yes gene_type:complete
MTLLVVLTQYKRNHLENQLMRIERQSIKPDYLVVFQNENHVNIDNLKTRYKFIHIKSDYNTKFFARFAICFTFPVDVCIVLDDDIMPGTNCLKNYMDQCINLNAIIGGNGRIGLNNKVRSKLNQPRGEGSIRKNPELVDFVGHLWCFKKEWLYHMFSIKPLTYDTGEDMHLCFTSKILGNINSYTAQQLHYNDMADQLNSKLATDKHSSYKTTSQELRSNVEKYFIENHKLNLITNN